MNILNIKCVVLGDRSVGKSALMTTYARNEFPVNSHGYEGNALLVDFEGYQVSLNLWDIPALGTENYPRLRCLSYPSTDVFILCFSIVDPASFENITTTFIPDVRRIMEFTPIILVGTKLDLREDMQTIETLRERNLAPITESMGRKVAKEIGAVLYMECSALTRTNLQPLFHEAIRHGLSQKESSKEPTPEKKRGCCLS